MKLLKIIKSNSLDDGNDKNFRVRRAARAVVFDNNKRIGLLRVSNRNYHKLPGGV